MDTQHEQTLYDDFETMPPFQGQPGSPHSNMGLLQGIINYGFEKPSEIQQKTIGPIFAKKNVIGQAQSGCGKTGAFIIGTLSIIDPSLDAVQAIVLANTHELADQIYNVCCTLSEKLLQPKKVALCVGRQVSVQDNILSIRHGCQILVGTPGRIKDLVFRQANGRPLIKPSNVRIIVMDEADCLFADKFKEDVVDIVYALDNHRRDALQLGIFSATFTPDSLTVARTLCVPDHQTNPEWHKDPGAPVEVLIPVEELTLDGIAQYYYDVESERDKSFEEKADFICALNDEHVIPMCIVYVNNRKSADRLKYELNSQGMTCECIYGDMNASQRNSIIQSFRRCECRFLISTDLLSRGIDIQQVKLVINFDIPYVTDRDTAEPVPARMAEYLHRIGRSGRFGRKGLAINIIANVSDKSRLEAIEKWYDTKVHVLPDDIKGLY